MIRIAYALVLALVPMMASAVDPLPFANEIERERYRDLAAELRCLVCQNQSLADSPATLAGDLRRVVLEQMRLGKSDAEVKAYLVERYGDFVLYRPPLDGRTWWLWFGPGILAIVALTCVILIVRRRKKQATDDTALRPVEGEEW